MLTNSKPQEDELQHQHQESSRINIKKHHCKVKGHKVKKKIAKDDSKDNTGSCCCVDITSSTDFTMKLTVFALLLVLAASSCSADTGGRIAGYTAGGRPQQWLIGLTAVVGFLFIVFVILIAHRLLKKRRAGKRDDGEVYFDYTQKETHQTNF
ncbi:uncharacterized protein V6R79_018624 [Siganus canaliculatus]